MGDKNQNQTQDINQLLQVRREKLANLQQAGKDPFQITKFNQTHHSVEAKKLYEAHEAELLRIIENRMYPEWMRSRQRKH